MLIMTERVPVWGSHSTVTCRNMITSQHVMGGIHYHHNSPEAFVKHLWLRSLGRVGRTDAMVVVSTWTVNIAPQFWGPFPWQTWGPVDQTAPSVATRHSTNGNEKSQDRRRASHLCFSCWERSTCLLWKWDLERELLIRGHASMRCIRTCASPSFSCTTCNIKSEHAVYQTVYQGDVDKMMVTVTTSLHSHWPQCCAMTSESDIIIKPSKSSSLLYKTTCSNSCVFPHIAFPSVLLFKWAVWAPSSWRQLLISCYEWIPLTAKDTVMI